MVDEITPRERVQLALHHVETDRVPVDLLATNETWALMRDHLGVPDNESVMKRLGVDLRHPHLRYIGPPLKTLEGGAHTDVWGITWKPVSYDGGVYDEVIHRPLAEIEDASQLGGYPWPLADSWDIDSLALQIADWDREREYAICLDDFGDPGGIFEISWYMRGFERFLEDMVLRPEIPYEIMTHVTDFYCALAKRVLTQLGQRIDLVWTSDDIAHQQGLIVSIPLWQKLIRPHHARFNRLVHELGGRIMYHSCGSVVTAIPHLIEAGIDVLDVLQFSAAGMEPESIKGRVGDKLAFHGGVDVQHLLPFATAEEVAHVVGHVIEVLRKGGGFILSPSHNIQVDVPLENILAIYKAAGSIKP